MHSIIRSFLILGALASVAEAHVSISSGPAAANKSQIITLGVGHGCHDAQDNAIDTIKIRVTIPAGVTSIRALSSDFGKPTLIKSGTTVTHVEWTKAAGTVLQGDDGYYELKLRARVPDAPFTKLKFDVEQTCSAADANGVPTGTPVVALWDQAEDSTTGNPAPFLTVVPARSTGWNKFKVTRELAKDEVPVYLGDALIVWKGSAAYSSNANTAMLITTTPGVTALDGLATNDEIWVKY